MQPVRPFKRLDANANSHRGKTRDSVPAMRERKTMNDLPKRLRLQADNYLSRTTSGKLLHEAADEIDRLKAELAAAKTDLARLAGTCHTYCDAPAQIRGAAYRDMAGTLAALDGHWDEAYGWPACYRRVERERDDARAFAAAIADETIDAYWDDGDEGGFQGTIDGDDAGTPQTTKLAALKAAWTKLTETKK